MKIRYLVSAVAAAFMLSGAAHTAPADDASVIRSAMRTNIDGMKRLPVAGLSIVEAGGKVFLVSDNGRIVVANGKIYDMWHMAEIKSMSDVDRYANKISLEKIGLNVAELGALSMGTGKKEVVIFMDPTCPHCHRVLKQAAKLTAEYTFHIVMLPLLGGDSTEKARKAVCAVDRQAALKAVLDDKYDTLAQKPECNTGALQKAVVTAKIIGIESVPFLISHDGTMQRGAPKDLSEFLTNIDAKVVDNSTTTRNNNRSGK